MNGANLRLLWMENDFLINFSKIQKVKNQQVANQQLKGKKEKRIKNLKMLGLSLLSKFLNKERTFHTLI